jgi:glycerol-3-phosphate acyltransferase PlsY
MLIAIMLVAAYLFGSIPTAVIAGRLLKGTDIRTQGSGNAGATNAARILGLRAGLVVAVIDLAKGLAAVLLVSLIAPLPGPAGPVLCGMAAALSRWIVVASLTAAFVLPAAYLVSCAFGAVFDPWRMAFCAAVFLIAVFTHRGNIARLFRGEEKKLDLKAMFRRRP